MIELNASEERGIVDVIGNIKSIETGGAELIIYDTPGPNNSQDKTHGEITKKILNDGNFGLVIYVMNATQFGVDDDAKLLTKLFGFVEHDLKNKEILFVLNKADQVDECLGESLDKLVSKAKDYLNRLGFESATIFPVSAIAALLARKSLYKEHLTRKEKRLLSELIDQSQDAEKCLYEHANISAKQKNEVKKQSLTLAKENSEIFELIDYSGITAVEFFLAKKLGSL